MLPRLRLALAVFTCALGLAGCGSIPSRGSGEATQVEVVNRSVLDMTIYVLPDGLGRQRLGTANGVSTTRLTIPQRLVLGTQRMVFQADPVGSTRTQLSQDILVSEGDVVVLEIPPE